MGICDGEMDCNLQGVGFGAWGSGGVGNWHEVAMWVQHSRNMLGLISLDLSELLARFDDIPVVSSSFLIRKYV